MIRLKTAVLLGGALKIGAIIGGASETDADCIYRFGESLGLAFQLQDDWLDVYGDPARFGKKIGGDILNNKKTYMLINARQRVEGKDAEELSRWLSAAEYDPSEKIAAVTALYDRVGCGRFVSAAGRRIQSSGDRGFAANRSGRSGKAAFIRFGEFIDKTRSLKFFRNDALPPVTEYRQSPPCRSRKSGGDGARVRCGTSRRLRIKR